jgi:DNA-binding beta-propeller fold protein YncE
MKSARIISVALLAACTAPPQTVPVAGGPGSCNDPAREASLTVDVPGSPFQALPSADGCWIFVSSAGPPRANKVGIAVYRRFGGRVSLERVLPLPTEPSGMVLTHDEKILIVAARERVAFINVAALTSGDRRPIIGYITDPAVAGRVYANVSSNDRYVFIADENSKSISVIDLVRAAANGFNPAATVGRVPTGTLPISLTLTAGDRYMFATSQWAPASYGWPVECKREAGNGNNDPTPINPQGAIHVIDVSKLETDPAHSIVANVPAGCSPVRLVLSPDGSRAYVTARNSNALLAFDAAKLVSDPAHARVGEAAVGTAPVGIAVIDSGRTVIVTNSNRFAGRTDDQQTLTVVDAAKMESSPATGANVGSIRAGAFPREMRVTADGRTLVLTNFGSKTIQLVDLTRRAGWTAPSKP